MSDSTNINDPAGVTALLESLRKSQAWQALDAQNETPRDDFYTPKVPELGDSSSSTALESLPVEAESSKEASGSSSNILSLLARLQSTSQTDIVPIHRYTHENVEATKTDHVLNTPTNILPPLRRSNSNASIHRDKPLKAFSAPSSSVRNMSFSQALPVIANLASDDAIPRKLKKIREQQNSLERQLWEERNQLIRSQEERLRVSETKAAIIGVSMSEKEIEGQKTLSMDELRKFDLERVLPAWDSLVTSQQRALEELGVPGIFLTMNKVEREKQQRIIQVLEGLSGPDSGVNDQLEEGR